MTAAINELRCRNDLRQEPGSGVFKKVRSRSATATGSASKRTPVAIGRAILEPRDQATSPATSKSRPSSGS